MTEENSELEGMIAFHSDEPEEVRKQEIFEKNMEKFDRLYFERKFDEIAERWDKKAIIEMFNELPNYRKKNDKWEMAECEVNNEKSERLKKEMGEETNKINGGGSEKYRAIVKLNEEAVEALKDKIHETWKEEVILFKEKFSEDRELEVCGEDDEEYEAEYKIEEFIEALINDFLERDLHPAKSLPSRIRNDINTKVVMVLSQ